MCNRNFFCHSVTCARIHTHSLAHIHTHSRAHACTHICTHQYSTILFVFVLFFIFQFSIGSCHRDQLSFQTTFLSDLMLVFQGEQYTSCNIPLLLLVIGCFVAPLVTMTITQCSLCTQCCLILFASLLHIFIDINDVSVCIELLQVLARTCFDNLLVF